MKVHQGKTNAPLILFLTELCHLLDVSAVAGHGVVLAAFLLHYLSRENPFYQIFTEKIMYIKVPTIYCLP